MTGLGLLKRSRVEATPSEQISPQAEEQYHPTKIEAHGLPPVTTEKPPKWPTPHHPSKRHVLPTYIHEGRLRTKGIHPDGESGRSGFHPKHFLRVAWYSATPWNMYINLLWPFVPAAIALHFIHGNHHTATFAVNFIAMIPPASLLGFAGQELARKLPKVLGIVLETTISSTVEIVLFIVLVVHDKGTGRLIPVIKAAILGSILANLLFCLGACFLVGGVKWKEQKFHAVISETGSGLMLVAGFGLLIPTAFYATLVNKGNGQGLDPVVLSESVKKISYGTSIILMFAFVIYIVYNMFSHDSIFEEVLNQDEELDNDRERDLAKQKFTLFEAVLAILIALTFVTMIAIFLVFEIEPLVRDDGVKDNFVGLILVPLVEKIAEHITAVDEAYDNQINFALFHCLAPSVQTALFNAPLVVIVGWGLGRDMDLNFDVFMIIVLILAILVVGNMLRDGASNYLEGGLLLLVYLIIALTTWYLPNPATETNESITTGEGNGELAQLAARSIQALMH